jgi:diguanylate cyclase (GGDEF)-like protein/PAS domain S-box-containing protein
VPVLDAAQLGPLATAVFRNSRDVTALIDERGTILWVSPAAERTLGWDPDALVGTSSYDLVHPDDVEVGLKQLSAQLAGGSVPDPSTIRFRHDDGTWVPVETAAARMERESGIEGIIVSLRDVTWRREAQEAREALRANEQRMRALVEHSDNLVEIIDARARIQWISPACQSVLGWRQDELTGRQSAELVHPDDLDTIALAFLEAIDSPMGRSSAARGRIACANGEWKWLECAFTNRIDDPAVRGIIGNFRDISEQLSAETALAENERLFRSLAQSSPTGIYQQDAELGCVYVNETWQEITGLTFEQAMGDGWRQMVHPEDRGWLGVDLARPIDDTPLTAEFRIQRPDGEVRWVAIRTQPMTDDDGNVIGGIGAMGDITERMEAQRDTQRLTDIFEATHDIVGIADREGQMLYFNASARRFFGLPEHGGLEGENLLDKFTEETATRLTEEIRPELEANGMWYGELSIVRADGKRVPVLAQLLTHNDADGKFEFFSGVMHDISERKRFESELAHQATHDPLTSLPNRVLLLDRLEQALERAQRHHKRVAVLFLDLDHFKVVNDSLGHGVGDRLLVAIAERLKTVVRPGDTIARFGGDEFVVLCEDLETQADAIAVAERVNGVISGPFPMDESEVFIGVSIGIAFPDDIDAEPGTLIRDADAAMYRAKERGRARFEVFDNQMRASAVDRLDIENALRRAQERRELRVLYQPIISLVTGRVIGVEALIRWEHPERGMLNPGEFIRVAEETGLIVPMGAWVLDQSCRQIMRWQASIPDLGPLKISVNLSGRQLGHPNLVADVKQIISDTHINPSQVELEITESVLMDDVEMSEDALGQLKKLGVKLAVDDFGTGYSSLSYLRRFPVDVLKVDQSFLDGLGEDPSDSAIVTAIVTLAHTLGLSAVGEGVETQTQLDELRHLGCDMAQGFLMARPGTGHDVEELLARRPLW